MSPNPPDSSDKVVGVDTNILINFGNFRRLAWKELFPNAPSITVLVSAKVQSEMDRHKDHGGGYARKRAKEFQAVLRAAEDSGYEISFNETGIPVRCVFLDRPQTDLLDGSRFDLTDSDELIVAQYHFASQKWGPITIVANDASPIRAAKRALMSALRPDPWTADRTEPEDETTRALRERTHELERIVGARPRVELKEFSVRGSGEETVRFADDFDYAGFQTDMRSRLADRIDLPTRLDLLKRFGKRLPSVGHGLALPSPWGGIGEKELHEWDSKLYTFQSHFDRISETQMLASLRMLSRTYVIEITIRNNGEAPDRNICVDMEARGTANIFGPRDLQTLNDWKINKPKPPSFQGPMLPSLTDFTLPPREDEHSFYRTKRNGVAQSHRCAVFMQGQEATIRAYFLAKNDGETPSVLVRIGAQHLLSPIVREVNLVPQPITLNLDAIHALIRDRLELMPEKQADILRAALDGR
ncbi:hypothetical protein ELG63_28225 (plasmid) [Rhizobium leguminosarum]|uniref:hypothetical protein n=1 Tax=Rhizobium leguminosarum TaxID=384 RepID=UPI00102F666F|nr:hypothetical protein [Rhizobium leguminosarum]TBF68275.1 hypothetical protein ELG89_28085 [Rhizobium leguminosarum]TBG52005.1 hypothetical protein ELG71_28680 [Rhizobium leguminosarum]TBH32830.1 hypothetical protein ELG63_28225 [Rhizobium leguminosarum]